MPPSLATNLQAQPAKSLLAASHQYRAKGSRLHCYIVSPRERQGLHPWNPRSGFMSTTTCEYYSLVLFRWPNFSLGPSTSPVALYFITSVSAHASFIPHHLHLPNLRLFDGHRAFHSTARDGVGCHTFAVAILGGGTKPPHHPGCFNVTRAGLQLGPHTVGAGHILPNSPATLFHSALCSCILGMCGSSPAIRSTAFRLCSIAAGLR